MTTPLKKAELVIIPSPGIGHLVSAVEMARVLIDQAEQLSITVLIMQLPYNTKVTNNFKSPSTPGIRFVELPYDEPSSQFVSPNPFLHKIDVIDSYRPRVRDILTEVRNSKSVKLAGVIIDMFCTTMIDVANEFGVPTYVFFPSSASMLGLIFHLQSLRDDFNLEITEYKGLGVELSIPTYINPVPVKLLPSIFFDKEGSSNAFLNLGKNFRKTKGILINTFLEFESHAVKTLSKDETIPPVYAVGPILQLKGNNDKSNEVQMILDWLDLQANSSVVFLCFGSRGFFDEVQVKEIAYALEHCGHQFLWSLRKPPPQGKIFPGEFENLDEILPKGFLQCTAEIGKVIGWAPQVEVLSHPAVGGFISHCGWNSTMESVWFGVPMATWPLYAEQQVNAFELVKDLGIAVEIQIDYNNNYFLNTSSIVKGDEIAERIRQLMDPANEVRVKVKEMQEKSRLALMEGGSSNASLKCFIEDMKNDIQGRIPIE